MSTNVNLGFVFYAMLIFLLMLFYKLIGILSLNWWIICLPLIASVIFLFLVFIVFIILALFKK
jgi:hypothetical protein